MNHCSSYEPLLKQITRLYPQNAFLDDINSIAIDQENENIYVTNTASGTIDIISYSSITDDDSSDNSLTIIRSIDINLQGSPYFKLDYITSITYTNKGYIVATLIPYNYAKLPGWLVFIDPDTQYIENFIPLKYCYSPKHIVPTSDGTKLIIACEGLADANVADPAGSISVVDIKSNDPTKWEIHNIGFTTFDDCDDSYDEELVMKHLPDGIYLPKPEEVFSINAEPEYVTIDGDDRFAYISLQENNGIAILDVEKLEISEIFSFGAHDFGYTGLDPSDKDNGINIMTYQNVYGLRQPDGIIFYQGKNGKIYILTANEGNAKYFDTVRVNTVELDSNAFPNGDILKKDDNLGRLQILNAGEEYGLNEDDEFEKLYAFGSRDWAAWEIEGGLDESCPYTLGEECSQPDGGEFTAYDHQLRFDSQRIYFFDKDRDELQPIFNDIQYFINNPYCTKDDDFFTYGVEAGPEYLDDKLVECNDFVRFCIMDGDECSNSEILFTTIDNLDYITCKQSVRDSCQWKIPTPICQGITAPNTGGDDSADGYGSSTTNAPSAKPTTITTTENGYFNNNDVIYTPNDPNYVASIMIILILLTIQSASLVNQYSAILTIIILVLTTTTNSLESADSSMVDYSSKCYGQGPCLELSVMEYKVNNKEEYRVCMYWNGELNGELNGCNKRPHTSFYEASIAVYDSDKTFRWESGLNNQLCKIVMCGNEASFGLKDESCASSVDFKGIVDDINDVSCTGINAGYGMTYSCEWNIPTPICKHSLTRSNLFKGNTAFFDRFNIRKEDIDDDVIMSTAMMLGVVGTILACIACVYLRGC